MSYLSILYATDTKQFSNNEITNLSHLVGWIKYWFAVAALQCRVFPKLYMETRKKLQLILYYECEVLCTMK